MKLIKYITSCLSILCSFTIISSSQATPNNSQPLTLTLRDAVMLALRGNPDLESAELDRITQKYALVVAQNAFEPQYSLTGAFNSQYATAANTRTVSTTYNAHPAINLTTGYGTKFTLDSQNPFTWHGTYNPTLTFTVLQPLIRGFGKTVVEAALQNAYDQEKINKLNMKNTVINTVNLIIVDYLSVVQTQETLKVDQASLKNYEQSVENDKALIEAGRMAKSDIVQDQAQVAAQQATIKNDFNTINQAKLKLINDLGLDPRANIIIPTNIDFDGLIKQLTKSEPFPPMDKCQQMALDTDVTYQTSKITLNNLARNVLTAKDLQRWQLNLTLSEMRGTASGTGKDANISGMTNGRNHTETVGLNLTIPIDDVAAKQQLLQARVALENGKIAFDTVRRQLESDVQDTRDTVTSSLAQLELSRQSLVLQKKTVEIANMKHNAGRISSFELLTQQKTLASSERDVVNNLIAYVTAITNFEEKIGITLDRWGIAIRN